MKKYWILKRKKNGFTLDWEYTLIESGETNKNTKELLDGRDPKFYRVIFG